MVRPASSWADGLLVGGIFPFRVPVGLNPTTASKTAFTADPSLARWALQLREYMYDPERAWREPATVLVHDSKILRCRLSSGRDLRDVGFQACVSIYPRGIATMMFWVDLSEFSFSTDEIIELAALARGTSERIDGSGRSSVEFAHNSARVGSTDFLEVCRNLRAELSKGIDSSTHASSAVEFVYPLIYVCHAIGCEVAGDIRAQYAREVAGVCHLWTKDWSSMKDPEVEKVLTGDVHPFNYGMTIVTGAATVEVHPANVQAAADREGISIAAHHFRERWLLSFLCEVPVLQYFTLRAYDAQLSADSWDLDVRITSLANPLFTLGLLRKAVRLGRLESDLRSNLNHFRNVHLTRKPYIQEAMQVYRAALGTERVATSLEEKISAVNDRIATTYSMLTTMFAVALSVVGAVFAVVQVIEAGCQVQWWECKIPILTVTAPSVAPPRLPDETTIPADQPQCSQ